MINLSLRNGDTSQTPEQLISQKQKEGLAHESKVKPGLGNNKYEKPQTLSTDTTIL